MEQNLQNVVSVLSQSSLYFFVVCGCPLLQQGTTKINLAADKLPQFQSCKLRHPDPGPQHVGTIHIGSERYDFVWSC